MINWLPIVLPLALSAGVSMALLPPAIRLGHRWGMLDMPGQHKRHQHPTPLLGGLVLLIAFWTAVLATALLVPSALQGFTESLFYVFAGALIVTLVGWSDDLRPLSAWVKLLSQIAAAIVLYAGGLGIDPLTIPFYGPVALGHWSLLITIVWVVLLTNAVNLIDGLDGLASGVSLIGALVLLVVGRLYGVPTITSVAAALIGFLAVFLYFNKYPAKVFLGDAGSLQLGFYFAVISLVVPIRSITAAALYVPLLALGVPLMETVAAFVRRLSAGRSVMQADRRHLFHLLALAGWSPRRIVLTFYGLSAVFGLSALAMFYFNRRVVTAFLVLFMVVILVAFLILRTNLLRRKHRRRLRLDDRNENQRNGA